MDRSKEDVGDVNGTVEEKEGEIEVESNSSEKRYQFQRERY
jgi:hypothetical protein